MMDDDDDDDDIDDGDNIDDNDIDDDDGGASGYLSASRVAWSSATLAERSHTWKSKKTWGEAFIIFS